jgi:hypothetical protein
MEIANSGDIPTSIAFDQGVIESDGSGSLEGS